MAYCSAFIKIITCFPIHGVSLFMNADHTRSLAWSINVSRMFQSQTTEENKDLHVYRLLIKHQGRELRSRRGVRGGKEWVAYQLFTGSTL